MFLPHHAWVAIDAVFRPQLFALWLSMTRNGLKMSNKPVSEKSIEILFNRCLLQSFSLGVIHLFAPTSFDEYRSGYDGKIVGKNPLREMYLQFKAPSFSEKRNDYTVQITPHQHQALQRLYPPKSAYYVTPMFRTLEEFKDAQVNLLGSVSNFLMHFICIDAASVPAEAGFFNYYHTEHRKLSPKIRYKRASDGNIRKGKHPASPESWCNGRELLSRFKSGDVGTNVKNGMAEKLQISMPLPVKKDALATDSFFGLGESGFGSIVRIG